MSSTVRVFNPFNRPVQVSANGQKLGGLREGNVDSSDPVAAAAIESKKLVLLGQTDAPVAVTEPEPVAHSEEPLVEESSVESPEEAGEVADEADEASVEVSPSPRPRKKPATQAKEF